MIKNYYDLNFTCRLCLTKVVSSALQEIQENVVKFLNNLGVQIQIIELINVPQKICNKCEKTIENILKFINQCKANSAVVKSMLLCEDNIENDAKLCETTSYFNDTKQNIVSLHKDIHQPTVIANNIPEDKSECYTRDQKLKATETEIVCEKCNISLKSKVNLSTHYKKNAKCRPTSFKIYKCLDCDKEYFNLRDKREHDNVHTGKNPNICSYCKKQFKYKTNLRRHIYRHEFKLGLKEKKAGYTEKRIELKLKCDKCEKVFASRSGFQHHMLRHEGNTVPRKHKIKLDKNIKHFLCNYCAMRFYVKANLDAHLRVHTGERPYKCNQCEEQFKQKSVLDRHTLSHLDIRPKPFTCDICQKSFTTKAHMKIHKRLHTGEKPYECNFCQKSFNYKTRWRIHLRIHTGESPFACNVCNNTYHDKGSLRKHQGKKGHMSNEDSKNITKNNHDENDIEK